MKPMQIYIMCTVLLLSACLREILAKKEGETISEDKGVLVLTESNLNQALKQHSQLLVHFCEYVCESVREQAIFLHHAFYREQTFSLKPKKGNKCSLF